MTIIQRHVASRSKPFVHRDKCLKADSAQNGDGEQYGGIGQCGLHAPILASLEMYEAAVYPNTKEFHESR